MKEKEKTKIKPLSLLYILMILAAVSGCTFFPETGAAPYQEKGRLLISVGVSPYDASRKTFTPDVDLYNFEKIVLKVTQEIETEVEKEIEIEGEDGEPVTIIVTETVTEIVEFANITLGRNESKIVELIDLPYDTYIITAWAYISASHSADEFAAFVEMEFNFSYNNYRAAVIMDLLIGEGTTGTLRYKLLNTVLLPVTAELYPFENISEQSKMTLFQGLNPFDTVSGYHSMTLPTGFYLFFFGDKAPSVVHIYKNMETLLDDEYTLYGKVSSIIPQGTDVQIIFSCDGSPVSTDENLSFGKEVTITIIRGDEYRYTENSLKLNASATYPLGADNNWFIAPEVKNPDGSYSRTFKMPGYDIEVSIDTEIIPVIDIDFNDPNMYRYFRFLSVPGNEEIDYVYPGQTVKIVLDHPSGGEIPFVVHSWWLDIESQADTANMMFTVPDPCDAWNVTVLLTIGNVPHSVSIPIGHN